MMLDKCGMKRHARRVMVALLAVPSLVLAASACVTSDSDAPELAGPADEGAADVWGEDNRQERYQLAAPAHRAAAQAGVALVAAQTLLPQSDGSYANRSPTLGTRDNLCSNQRFTTQPTMAFCSGTLIGPDVVLTAGHCMVGACANIAVVLHYAYEERPADPFGVTQQIAAQNVYRCAEVLAVSQPGADRVNPGPDYAILRLDRAVTVAAPAAIAATAPADPARAFLVSHPNSLPQKIGAGNWWLPATGARYIEHTAPGRPGASGGGLFNQRGELIGVHARGDGQPYVRSAFGNCNMVPQCGVNTTCSRPNRAYNLSEIFPLLKSLGIALPNGNR